MNNLCSIIRLLCISKLETCAGRNFRDFTNLFGLYPQNRTFEVTHEILIKKEKCPKFAWKLEGFDSQTNSRTMEEKRDCVYSRTRNHECAEIHKFTNKFFNFHEFANNILSFHESRTKSFSRTIFFILTNSRTKKKPILAFPNTAGGPQIRKSSRIFHLPQNLIQTAKKFSPKY